MASYSSFFAFILHGFLFLSISNAQPSSSSRPGGLVFTVSRDPSTLQYVTNISLGKVRTNLVIDLGGSHSWIYSSRGCASTPISGAVIARSNDLKNGEWVSGPNVTARGISFGCESTTGVLRGLAKGANGIAGLGLSKLSLTSQFSAAFRFPQKVTLRLTSGDDGDMYFGDGPYTNQPFMHSFFYTPLITNSYFSSEYFVHVKSIGIDGKNVALNKGLLSINKNNGVGGTKFSPSVPYTTMETSIFKAFASVYIQRTKSMGIYSTKLKKYMGISMVAPVAPFSVCFNESTIERRIDGPVVPKILLGFFNNEDWRLDGFSNTLECVKNFTVCCLAFVDGGSKPKTSIVIGAYQMQSHIIEFDNAKSRLGISAPYQL